MHACVCSCSVVSQCWVIDGLATQIETGFWGGQLQGHHGARTEHALKRTGRALACCDRTEPGTLVTQHFMLPSFSLSLTYASPSALFLLLPSCWCHLPTIILILLSFGLCNILPFSVLLVLLLIFWILLLQLPWKQPTHMQTCTCTERERDKHFLYLEGSLSDALEDER